MISKEGFVWKGTINGRRFIAGPFNSATEAIKHSVEIAVNSDSIDCSGQAKKFTQIPEHSKRYLFFLTQDYYSYKYRKLSYGRNYTLDEIRAVLDPEHRHYQLTLNVIDSLAKQEELCGV